MTELGNKLSSGLQVRASFASKIIVLPTYVKSERNGEMNLKKKYQNTPLLPYNSFYLIHTVKLSSLEPEQKNNGHFILLPW